VVDGADLGRIGNLPGLTFHTKASESTLLHNLRQTSMNSSRRL
jgi:hypothetical protein